MVMLGSYDETPHLRGRKKFRNTIQTQNATSNKKVESDFATKMMEKMGWKEGKGLGAQLDGRTEIIQAERRDTGLGLGRSHKEETWNDDWWMNIYSGAMKDTKSLKTFKAKDTPELSRKGSMITRSQSRNVSRKGSQINLEDFVVENKKTKKNKKGKKVKEDSDEESEVEVVTKKKNKNKKHKEKIVESKQKKKVDSDDESSSDYDSDEEAKFQQLSKKIFKKKRT